MAMAAHPRRRPPPDVGLTLWRGARRQMFILSGARTVILSLWSVPSQETRYLMTGFYRRMAEGQSKAEALRETKLEVMKDRPNPFFWAAFVLVGGPQ